MKGTIAVVTLLTVFLTVFGQTPVDRVTTAEPLISDTAHQKDTSGNVNEASAPLAAELTMLASIAEEGDPGKITAMVKNKYPLLRAAAINALCEMPDTALTPLLSECLNDPDPSVRRNAVIALGIMGNHRAIAPLLTFASTRRDSSTIHDVDYALSRIRQRGRDLLYVDNAYQNAYITGRANAVFNQIDDRRLHRLMGRNRFLAVIGITLAAGTVAGGAALLSGVFTDDADLTIYGGSVTGGCALFALCIITPLGVKTGNNIIKRYNECISKQWSLKNESDFGQ